MTAETVLTVFFALSVSVLLLALVLGIVIHRASLARAYRDPFKRRTFLNPFQTFLIGFSLACVFIFIPIYYCSYFAENAEGFVRGFKSVLLSVHNTMRMFILDGEFDIVRDFVEELPAMGEGLKTAITVYGSLLYVVAPVLTAGFVLSFFKNAFALLKYSASPAKEIYLISELNEKSLALATNILTKDGAKGRLVVFTDVFERNKEESFELVTKARRLGAVLLRKDICELGLKPWRKNAVRKLYLIGEDEDENLRQALVLIARCREQKVYNTQNTQFYVFSTNAESEALLDSMDNGNMRVRRVNENRNLVIHTLYEHLLFHDAVASPTRTGEKEMNIVIAGLGGYGMEFLKAVCWSSQLPGYRLTVHVFDREACRKKVENIAPELVRYNGLELDGEPYYKIVFHDGIEIESFDFMQEVGRIERVTTAVVTLGDDELNIETAMRLRVAFGRSKIERGDGIPPILAVVYSPSKNAAVAHSGGIKNMRGDDYGIEFIGRFEQRYSVEVIEQKELEESGLACHLKWSEHVADPVQRELEIARNRAVYERHEYYRRASIAEAVYASFRTRLGLLSVMSKENEEMLAEYEHKRWNAFMRTEGYVGAKIRNDIAKTHHDLIPYAELTEDEKEKDKTMLRLNAQKAKDERRGKTQK